MQHIKYVCCLCSRLEGHLRIPQHILQHVDHVVLVPWHTCNKLRLSGQHAYHHGTVWPLKKRHGQRVPHHPTGHRQEPRHEGILRLCLLKPRQEPWTHVSLGSATLCHLEEGCHRDGTRVLFQQIHATEHHLFVHGRSPMLKNRQGPRQGILITRGSFPEQTCACIVSLLGRRKSRTALCRQGPYGGMLTTRASIQHIEHRICTHRRVRARKKTQHSIQSRSVPLIGVLILHARTKRALERISQCITFAPERLKLGTSHIRSPSKCGGAKVARRYRRKQHHGRISDTPVHGAKRCDSTSQRLTQMRAHSRGYAAVHDKHAHHVESMDRTNAFVTHGHGQ